MKQRYDVAVIGAGPAGAMAAGQIAACGAAVLLVDQAKFPRFKVCGCCINHHALATLARAGMEDLFINHAMLFHTLRLLAPGREASIPLPPGLVCTRSTFDQTLVERAMAAGVHFADEAAASLSRQGDPWHVVRLQRARGQAASQIEARVILVADGVGGRFLRGVAGFETFTRIDSRMGAGAVLEKADDSLAPGVVHMSCGRGGYVGVVRLQDGRFNVAAALDPAWAQSRGGPGPAACAIMAQAGLGHWDALLTARWRGTPRLTRRRSTLAANRIFVVGDAASYVEPFTGEGIAWALAGGEAVAQPILQAIDHWRPELARMWTRQYRRLIQRRQRNCRMVAAGLRQPRLTQLATALLSHQPGWARAFLHKPQAASEYLSPRFGGEVG